jgi:hypothetical protein
MIKRKVVPITGVLMLALLSMEFACSTNNYARAGKLAKDLAASVLVAQQVEIQVHRSGYIDDAEHKAIQSELLQIADAGMELDKAINQNQSASGATAEITVIRQLLSDLSNNKLSGIKNENAKIALQSALLTVQVIIDQIAAFGGKS